MLTPKCRSRDFHVRACVKMAQNRLCRSDENLRCQNLAGFWDKFGLTARPLLVPGRSRKAWLCWQSTANPSLPAKLGNTGRFRQKAGKAAAHPRRKSQHLNTLDAPLPTFANRENSASQQGVEWSGYGFRYTQPFLADFITTTSEFRFSVQTGKT
jgi:hypothetical protein